MVDIFNPTNAQILFLKSRVTLMTQIIIFSYSRNLYNSWLISFIVRNKYLFLNHQLREGHELNLFLFVIFLVDSFNPTNVQILFLKSRVTLMTQIIIFSHSRNLYNSWLIFFIVRNKYLFLNHQLREGHEL